MDQPEQLTIKFKSNLWKSKESEVHPGGLKPHPERHGLFDEADPDLFEDEEAVKPFGEVKKLNLKPRLDGILQMRAWNTRRHFWLSLALL